MTELVPGPLRRPSRAVRDAVRRATSGTRASMAQERRHRRAWAPVGAAIREGSGLRVAVRASERLRAGLAHHWTITDERPDAVLVEVDARSTVAIEAPLVDQRALVAGATVPVIVWITASSRPAVGIGPVTRLLQGVTAPVHVVVDDEGSIADWAMGLGREVRHAGPAAEASLHSPSVVGANRERDQVVALVGDGDFDPDRLAPLPGDRLDVIGGQDAGTEIPGDRPVLGHYRVAAFTADRPLTPWHVVEAAAAATPVLVPPETARRLPPEVAEEVTTVADDTQLRLQAAAHLWHEEVTARAGHAAARRVRHGHSFADRAALLEALVGRPRQAEVGPRHARGVSAVVSTNRAHELDNVADNLARQTELRAGRVQVVLVLHDIDLPTREVEETFAERGIDQLVIRRADSALTLGACLNLGIEASDGRFVAKIDDDNFYGRHYLADLVDAIEFSRSDIAGKWAHYTWLRSSGAVLLRNPGAEHRPERLVQGGSILMRRDVAAGIGFSDLPRGVDTDLLNRARDAGARTYSADRFGYVSIRGTDRHAHTWTIEDASLMNRASRVVFYGDPREHVDV